LEGKQQQWTFTHVPCEIGATEPEEVGVEHLLRDVKDTTVSTLANQVAQKLGSLKGLAARLHEVDGYLQNVLSGRIPVNHRIIYQLQVRHDAACDSDRVAPDSHLPRTHPPPTRPRRAPGSLLAAQDVFNLLPNLHLEALVKAFAVKTNDMYLAVYLASVIRAVVALHHLIDNKLHNKEKELDADKEKDRKEEDKEKKEGEADAAGGKEATPAAGKK
jgi:26S proteasome regulatory subunit N8